MAKYAEPTFPNAGVEAWYWGELQKLVHRMASTMLTALQYAWDGNEERLAEFLGDIATDAKKMGIGRPTLLRRALNQWGLTWTKRINDVSEEIARDFARRNKSATERAMRAKLDKAGFAVKFQPSERSLAAFENTVNYNVGLIKSIPQEFLTDVESAVWQSVTAGHDLKTLTEQLHDKYQIAWNRAAFIAEDQNSKAKATMERARRLDVGIKKAKWLHSHAGKEPRRTHVKKNGKSYSVERGWFDPDAGEYIWPGTLLKCRCSDAAEIPGFETYE